MPARQHVDLARSEFDRVRDRRVVGHTPIHQQALLPGDRRQHRRNRPAGHDGIDGGPAREQQFLAGHNIDRDDVKLDWHLLEARMLAVLGDELAQTRGGDEVIARSEKAEEATERVQRKDLPAPHCAPDTGSSLAVSTVWGREAMNAPLMAPAEVPTTSCGVMSRS